MIDILIIYLALGVIYLLAKLPEIRNAINMRQPYYNLGVLIFAIGMTCISTICMWPYGLYLDRTSE